MFEPDALLDIDQIAQSAGLPIAEARILLSLYRRAPVATYRGRTLWLSDAAHDLTEQPCASA